MVKDTQIKRLIDKTFKRFSGPRHGSQLLEKLQTARVIVLIVPRAEEMVKRPNQNIVCFFDIILLKMRIVL